MSQLREQAGKYVRRAWSFVDRIGYAEDGAYLNKVRRIANCL